MPAHCAAALTQECTLMQSRVAWSISAFGHTE